MRRGFAVPGNGGKLQDGQDCREEKLDSMFECVAQHAQRGVLQAQYLYETRAELKYEIIIFIALSHVCNNDRGRTVSSRVIFSRWRHEVIH